MLAQSSVDNTHVEEDLGGIGNALEFFQSLVELVVVIPRQGGDPCLDFLGHGGD